MKKLSQVIRIYFYVIQAVQVVVSNHRGNDNVIWNVIRICALIIWRKHAFTLSIGALVEWRYEKSFFNFFIIRALHARRIGYVSLRRIRRPSEIKYRRQKSKFVDNFVLHSIIFRPENMNGASKRKNQKLLTDRSCPL